MKQVVAGREMSERSGAGTASAAADITGAIELASTFMPACAVTQTEQAWCRAVESSG